MEKTIWLPDQSLLYMIHRDAGRFLDGEIITRPGVEIDDYGTWFRFVTNRGHMFKGHVVSSSEASLVFDRQETGGPDDGIYRVEPMTQNEFRAFQERSERMRNAVPSTMDELKKWFDDEAAWG